MRICLIASLKRSISVSFEVIDRLIPPAPHIGSMRTRLFSPVSIRQIKMGMPSAESRLAICLTWRSVPPPQRWVTKRMAAPLEESTDREASDAFGGGLGKELSCEKKLIRPPSQ